MKRKLDENDVPTVQGLEQQQASDSSTVGFGSFNLDSRLLQAIAKSQYSTPTPVQAETIPYALEGRDILAKSKTGSGKTAAYVLPCAHHILQKKLGKAKQKCISILVLVPTRELCNQVTKSFNSFAEFCAKDLRTLNLTQRASDAVLTAKLQETPDAVVSTPGKVVQLMNNGNLSLDHMQKMVIDEADLVLSYGYEDDIDAISKALPAGIQTILVSATLTPEVDQLKTTFCQKPVIVKIEDKEEAGQQVTQYIVKCGEEEKFLLLFVIFKLKLVKGKCIIFVGDIDRSYRLKLYLEQFGIRSCVLNSELPVNSRLHVVHEFNKGVYDIMIAADDQEVIGGIVKRNTSAKIENGQETELTDEETVAETTVTRKKVSAQQKDFGVSRGIDFQNIACVLNFDLPSNSKSYTHRIGRTARAGKSGMALSFVVPRSEYGKHRPTSIPSARHDERILDKIKTRQAKKGYEIKDYHFDMKQVEGFRYRMNDALRAVTGNAVREARSREIKQELLKSERLRRHFEENPEDLKALRHDTGTGGIIRIQGHLKHVPDYLLPRKQSSLEKTDASGLVGLTSAGSQQNISNKRRKIGKHKSFRGKKPGGKRNDPLKSFTSGKK